MSDTPEQQSKWLVGIANFLGEHNDWFECDCDAYMESDTGAWIHQENKCASFWEDHIDIVLRQTAEALLQGAAREAGLSLAATQYSESRDRKTAELSLLRSKLEQWVDDIRIGPAIRDDMRAFLNPRADNAYVFCAVHGTAPRAHPYYHDKGIHCATCAAQEESLTQPAPCGGG